MQKPLIPDVANMTCVLENEMTESETHLPFDEGVRRIFRYTWLLTLQPQDGRQTRQTDLCGWDGDIPIGPVERGAARRDVAME